MITAFIDLLDPFSPGEESWIDLPMRYDQAGIYTIRINNVCMVPEGTVPGEERIALIKIINP